eukprot:359757-Ditylum_brightwellii.AAC.1
MEVHIPNMLPHLTQPLFKWFKNSEDGTIVRSKAGIFIHVNDNGVIHFGELHHCIVFTEEQHPCFLGIDPNWYLCTDKI